MIGVNTNVLVRYIVQDDAQQARIATRFFEHTLVPARPGFVDHIVLCELVWVLESGYAYSRVQIAATLQRLFEIDRLRMQMPELVWHALDAYGSGIDFDDALIALVNEAEGCEHTVSFDRRAARFNKMHLLTR